MSAEGRDSLPVDLAITPVPGGDAPPSLGTFAARLRSAPTPEPSGVGIECPACRQSNHESVPQCVFCGSSMRARLDSADSEGPSTPPSEPRASQIPALGDHSTGSSATLVGLQAAADPASPPGTGGGANSSQVGAQSSLSAGSSTALATTAWVAVSNNPRASANELSSSAIRVSLVSGFDGITSAPIADPLIGVVVAERYRILEGLGRGGMGIVYKVEHTRIGKLLAMKLLTGELSRNPEVVRRFKHEALTASKLSSPNTVQVFDFGASDGLTYLVMELIAGEDLGRILRSTGPMPFSRLGRIIVQVCSSMAEAHQKDIVHRDIKPENIMLVRARDGTDVAKVLDFGLAKLRDGSDLNDVTSQGAIVGTPYFMSPEQVRGEPVDFRSDIYALGALMYRALTGHYPFNGPTPMSVFTKHLTEVPIPLAERAPERGISAAVDAMVMKALAKNAADRWQRIEDLQAALVEELRTLGTSSVDNLLDSGALRRLSKIAGDSSESSAVPGLAPGVAEIATRDEVEAYERRLRRQRYTAVASAAILAIACAGILAKLAFGRERQFAGVEMEPNNTAGEATLVPFGRSASGSLGKRLDGGRGDRDFYAIDVPVSEGESQSIRLTVTALPNMPMCTLVYRQGDTTALAQYCGGRPGRDLVIESLRMDPGRYLIAVMQDLDPYGKSVPFVYENVSDVYELRAELRPLDPARETEPNDRVASANLIVPGSARAAAIAWTRDEDMYCAAAAEGAIRWKVRDVLRAPGGTLEITPMRGAEEGAPVRVHASGAGSISATDVRSPWSSPAIPPSGDVLRCLRVRLTHDPWSSEGKGVVPSGGSEEYVVEVEAAP